MKINAFPGQEVAPMSHESDLIIETINATDAPEIPVEVDSTRLKDPENALAEAFRKRVSEIRPMPTQITNRRRFILT